MLERINAQRLDVNRKLEEQHEQERAENRKLKAELERLTERAVVLEEEVRWLKAQFFSRSTQQDLAEGDPSQRLPFNEAEDMTTSAFFLRLVLLFLSSVVCTKDRGAIY